MSQRMSIGSDRSGEIPVSLEDLLEVEAASTVPDAENPSSPPRLVPAATPPSSVPQTSSRLQSASRSLDHELEKIEGEIGRLQERQRQLQLQATLGHLQRIARAEEELAAAKQRVQWLEQQLGQTLVSATATCSNTVATLEKFPITRGLILYPCLPRGKTPMATVYGLTPGDVTLLQLGQRDPLFSCEPI